MKCLLVYACSNVIGNVDCDFETYPPKMEDIREAERQIKAKNNFSETPKIINILELSE